MLIYDHTGTYGDLFQSCNKYIIPKPDSYSLEWWHILQSASGSAYAITHVRRPTSRINYQFKGSQTNSQPIKAKVNTFI